LYQNDFYGYIKRAKGVLQPSLEFGYANGNYKEVTFISFKRIIHLPNPPPNGRDTVITITGRDSTDNKTSYFSVTPSIGHDFAFYGLFSKNDELDFEPYLLLNFGSDKLTQTHTNRIFDRPAFNPRKKASYSNNFQVQSVAASVHLVYMIKKFFIDTNLYADYYLPQTTENRFTFIFELSAGFTF
jgi:hypothetical protein